MAEQCPQPEEEEEEEKGINNHAPRAVFMAFGTKGDVLPVAALAAAFVREESHHRVTLITHSVYEYLKSDLSALHVSYIPIGTPPVFSIQDHDKTGLNVFSFSFRKKAIATRHKSDCLAAMEKLFADGRVINGDFIAINFFALEGWHLAELYQVPCVLAAPYVVPYSMPSSFECQFKNNWPILYTRLQRSHGKMVCWKDIFHWMWPLFSEDWELWRRDCLYLSPCFLTDPVTNLPVHDWPNSPLLLYGFSEEVVEFPDYWPSNVQVCGFWFPPFEWEFSCNACKGIVRECVPKRFKEVQNLCTSHGDLQHFLQGFPESRLPIFIGLSSAGSMGFIRNPSSFLLVLKAALEITCQKAILFTNGYEPLDEVILSSHHEASKEDSKQHTSCLLQGLSLFNNRLFCFSGAIPYKWVFSRCSVSLHHGGSGTVAPALSCGIPQIICPFIHDQFYWAERMFWLGVAPHPLSSQDLLLLSDHESYIANAASTLSDAIRLALSADMKSRAREVARSISVEDGIGKALKALKSHLHMTYGQ